MLDAGERLAIRRHPITYDDGLQASVAPDFIRFTKRVGP